MKTAKTLLLLIAATGYSQAASTLTFGSSSIFATNWANGAGTGGSLLAWGIVIDTDGDGFDSSSYFEGTNYATGLQTMKLSASTNSDDVLFVGSSGNLMTLTTNANDSGAIGLNRIGAVASVPYTNGISQGDSFAIIWFNKTALGGSAVAGDKFGVFTNAAFIMPSDGTASAPFTSVFTGADTLKTMNFSFQGEVIPEPSAALLGAVGALGLLRRRRA